MAPLAKRTTDDALAVGRAYTRTESFNKKESANELARLSLYKQPGFNKRRNTIYARYQQL
jgi:hypothetical protein